MRRHPHPRRRTALRALAVALLAACGLGGAQAAGGSGGGGGGGTGGGGATVDAVPGDRLLVLSQGDAITALLQKYQLSLTGRFGARPIFRVRSVIGTPVKDLAAALSLEAGVLSAEPNPRHASPERLKNNVWAIGTPQAYAAQWATGAIGLAAAQAWSTGAGVRVAVLDTGIDLAHPALAGRLLPGLDLVDGSSSVAESAQPGQGGYGHGTHVAGLVARVAPQAQILPIRVLDNDGGGNAWVLAEALLRAVDPDGNPDTADGAQVINLSLGGTSRTRLLATVGRLARCSAADGPDTAPDLQDPGYNSDRRRCGRRGGGALLVAAAGNDGSPSVRTYPAAEGAAGLLAVTASRSNGQLAGFANTGSWVAMAAPGDAITSSVPGGGYATWGGTSMAAPLVAGTAALALALRPDTLPQDLARCLVQTAQALSGTALRQLDAAAALQLLALDPSRCR